MEAGSFGSRECQVQGKGAQGCPGRRQSSASGGVIALRVILTRAEAQHMVSRLGSTTQRKTLSRGGLQTRKPNDPDLGRPEWQEAGFLVELQLRGDN